MSSDQSTKQPPAEQQAADNSVTAAAPDTSSGTPAPAVAPPDTSSAAPAADPDATPETATATPPSAHSAPVSDKPEQDAPEREHVSKTLFDTPLPPLPEHPDAHKTTPAPDGEQAAASNDAAERAGDTRKRPPATADSLAPHGRRREYSYNRYQTPTSDDSDYSFRSSDQPYSRARGRSRYRHRIGPAQFKNMTISYKNPDALRRFVTETGTILPRRITGISAKHQRQVTREIKRARFLALLPTA